MFMILTEYYISRPHPALIIPEGGSQWERVGVVLTKSHHYRGEVALEIKMATSITTFESFSAVERNGLNQKAPRFTEEPISFCSERHPRRSEQELKVFLCAFAPLR